MTIENRNQSVLLAGTLALVTLITVVSFSIAPSPKPIQNPTGSQNTNSAIPPTEPVYHDYKGVTIGMSTDDARQKLGKPKSKGPKQDYYVFSDTESAQVYYRDDKVFAVSAHYLGAKTGVPTAMEVLGIDVAPRKDGSISKLIRYPTVGYWVSYGRTAGKSPLVSITMQKIRTLK